MLVDIDDDLPQENFRTPRFIEGSDPLHDDTRLLGGPRICNEEDLQSNTLKKSASNHAIDGLRWGSEKRRTGLSKTGLCITVPSPRNDDKLSLKGQATSWLPTGPILQEGSILYTYSSSSSGGLRTSSSWGAIGDHLPSTKKISTNIRVHHPLQENFKSIRERASWDSSGTQRLDLKSLVETSVPDDQLYDLLVLREEGPLKMQIQPCILKANQLPLISRRRRSLSDLVKRSFNVKELTAQDEAEVRLRSCTRRSRPGIIDDLLGTEPELWERVGPSYRATLQLAMGHDLDENTVNDDLDPSTFSLPRGVSRPL